MIFDRIRRYAISSESFSASQQKIKIFEKKKYKYSLNCSENISGVKIYKVLNIIIVMKYEIVL